MQDFLIILKKYNINCVIDVRSNPKSKYYVDYNKDCIKQYLNSNGIRYRNYIEEFGARQINKNLYSNEGYLDFQKFSQTEKFKDGIKKICEGIKLGFTFVLMCAEKDPINCHRNILIAKEFYKLGYEIGNIMNDSNIQTQDIIEKRLLDMYYPCRNQISLFDNSETELIEQAYYKRNKEIGFKIEGE